ncbi:hypothetical protein [Streptomyces sp. NPDC050704]|uniref:hypothetical protein n=1 Tax=Streptomyces sp. NPDC050704 TaxID=3157219 RepID=UPI00342DFCDF
MPQPDRPGSRGDATWLTDGVLDVIARYSRPSDRVLLLASRSDVAQAVRLAALKRAAESATRLGRTVETRRVDLARHFGTPCTEDPTEPESVYGPTHPPSDPQPPGAVAHRTPVHRPESDAVGPERFDTVIAYVDSRSAAWADHVPWNELLGRAGLLAFLTYSHRGCDGPTGLADFLAGIAHRVGLVQLDQVAVPGAPDQTYADLLLFIPPLPGARDER